MSFCSRSQSCGWYKCSQSVCINAYVRRNALDIGSSCWYSVLRNDLIPVLAICVVHLWGLICSWSQSCEWSECSSRVFMLELMFEEIHKMLVVVAGRRVPVQFYRTAKVKTSRSESCYYRNVVVIIESNACCLCSKNSSMHLFVKLLPTSGVSINLMHQTPKF